MTEIRTAWQSMSDDNGGMCQVPGNFFWSREEARLEGDGWSGHPEPRMHRVLVTEEGTFLLSDRITVFDDRAAVLRARALEKLTPDERRALGL